MDKVPEANRRRRAADAGRYTSPVSRVAERVRSFVALASLIVLVVMPATGVAQSLVGKWRHDIEGFPIYWVFSDCGVLSIHYPGNSIEFTYVVKAEDPLKLEVCQIKPASDECGSVYVYLLGNETLQLIPDTTLPRAKPVLVVDTLMQRVPDDRGQARCEPEKDSNSERE